MAYKRLSKAQKKRNALKRKPKTPELYFVIGGGINRTKCPTADAAVAHATMLLERQRDSLPGAPLRVGVDLGRPGGDATAVMEGQWNGRTMRIKRMIEAPPAAWGDSTPKIETAQNEGGLKPFYIVKVVGVVELRPQPIDYRALTDGELE